MCLALQDTMAILKELMSNIDERMRAVESVKQHVGQMCEEGNADADIVREDIMVGRMQIAAMKHHLAMPRRLSDDWHLAGASRQAHEHAGEHVRLLDASAAHDRCRLPRAESLALLVGRQRSLLAAGHAHRLPAPTARLRRSV